MGCAARFKAPFDYQPNPEGVDHREHLDKIDETRAAKGIDWRTKGDVTDVKNQVRTAPEPKLGKTCITKLVLRITKRNTSGNTVGNTDASLWT